jgi:hypothetical protein
MGGFSAVIGNPPFLGGQKLTGTYGNQFRDFIVQTIANGTKGSADLCSYFFLVCFDSIKQNGRAGLVATNTIAQGATREVGLARIVGKGGTIPAAMVNVPWSGDAAVMVNVVTIKRGEHKQPASLNGLKVESVNEYLVKPGTITGNPFRLNENSNSAGQGSIILGSGFLITEDKSEEMIKSNPANQQVLFPCLNGKDLNNNPNHFPSRWCVNFFDWSIEEAKKYREPWQIVENEVKPFRQRRKDDGSYVCREPNPTTYWIYCEKRTALYSRIHKLNRVMVIALTSKVVMPVWVPSNWVYSHACGVFTFDDDFTFGVLSSQFHWWWTQRYASSMKGDTRYTPRDVFETFPRPLFCEKVEHAGFELNTHRAPMMIRNNEGLTKTYNRMHNPEENDPGIEKLRQLHTALDIAVRDAYGWQEIELRHGFHDTKQGTRWTISPEAQRQVLDRLLALNHERYELENGG